MPQKTSIGFYIENYSPGGLERLLFDLLASFPLDRYAPVLFYAGDKNFPERLKREKVTPPELVWVPVYTTKHLEDWCWSKSPPRLVWLCFLGFMDLVRWFMAWLNIRRCREALRRHPVVNLHVINGGYPSARSCLSAVIAACELRIPMVTMTVTAEPQARRWPILERYFDQRVEDSVRAVVSNCDYLTTFMRKRRGFAESKTVTIHGGIAPAPVPSKEEIDAFCRRLSLAGRPLIGSVAVLQHHKGQRFLLHSVAALKRDFPHLCCLIVGDGVERKKLEALADELGIRENVCFAGHVSDFRTAMAAMDIFVHPSLQEGFPYVILEAMSLGKAIVATTIAGIPEQIENGVSGLLVPPGKIDSLSEALRSLLKDAVRARDLGNHARDRAKLFTAEEMIKKFHQFYS